MGANALEFRSGWFVTLGISRNLKNKKTFVAIENIFNMGMRIENDLMSLNPVQ